MKRMLLFLLLLPLTTIADDLYPATVDMADGSTKSGVVELPRLYSSYLEFRTDEKAQKEKLKPEDVTGFHVTINGTVWEYRTVKLGYPKMMGKGLRFEKDKCWMRVEKTGTVVLLGGRTSDPDRSIGGMASKGGEFGFTVATLYAIIQPGEDFATYFLMHVDESIKTRTIINEYKMVERVTKYYFGEKCPSLMQTMTKDIIKSEGIPWIVDYYNKNCGK